MRKIVMIAILVVSMVQGVFAQQIIIKGVQTLVLVRQNVRSWFLSAILLV